MLKVILMEICMVMMVLGANQRPNAWKMVQTLFCVDFEKQSNEKNIVLQCTTEVSI